MKKLPFALLATALSGLMITGAFAGVKSGLQVGEFTRPFQVVDVSGPHKGQQLCYR